MLDDNRFPVIANGEAYEEAEILAVFRSPVVTFDINYSAASGANAERVLVEYVSFPFTIVEVHYSTTSGTIDADIELNGVAITNLTELGFNSIQDNGFPLAPEGPVAIGDKLTILFYNNSAAVNPAITLTCTRQDGA